MRPHRPRDPSWSVSTAPRRVTRRSPPRSTRRPGAEPSWWPCTPGRSVAPTTGIPGVWTKAGGRPGNGGFAERDAAGLHQPGPDPLRHLPADGRPADRELIGARRRTPPTRGSQWTPGLSSTSSGCVSGLSASPWPGRGGAGDARGARPAGAGELAGMGDDVRPGRWCSPRDACGSRDGDRADSKPTFRSPPRLWSPATGHRRVRRRMVLGRRDQGPPTSGRTPLSCPLCGEECCPGFSCAAPAEPAPLMRQPRE